MIIGEDDEDIDEDDRVCVGGYDEGDDDDDVEI